ncbi:hypothetical protein [Pleurocapsa sp. CCALA 161]|uniref:hypothetical protein n=1 Tax=Pleurocapsa sp. CCALA 161 TaxID=2107688 RepID=UPI0011B23DB5|nr:hypothetical protein [Pleurocapsa sp. CCALA 161]
MIFILFEAFKIWHFLPTVTAKSVFSTITKMVQHNIRATGTTGRKLHDYFNSIRISEKLLDDLLQK